MAPFRKLLYLIAITAFSAPCWAQSDVVVDMSVLEDLENYNPPPMFQDGAVAIPVQDPVRFPMDVKTNNNSVNPSVSPSQSVYIPKTPPIPKRRPSVLNASVSFIQEIRESKNMDPITEDKMPVIVEKPKGLPGPEADAMDINADPLTQALHAPSAQDIYKSIVDTAEAGQSLNSGPDISLYVRKRRAREIGDSTQIISFAFGPQQADLNEEIESIISKKALAILRDGSDLRVEVQAFASPNGEGQSSARRLALSRAINIRAFLIEQSVDPKRIDLRALGSNTDIEPADRVDLLFLNPADSL